MKNRAVVFAPHPDDETLCCGGTIVKKLKEGWEVSVVFMADGRHALSELFGICSDPSPPELKEMRKEEAKRATKVLGLKEDKLIFLDVEDGMLEKNDETLNQVSKLLKRLSPVEIYFPHIKDLSHDHKMTNLIVKDSIERMNLDSFRYQYIVTPRFLRLSPLFNEVSKFFRNHLVEVDISQFLHIKKMAINEYKSQVSIVSSKQKRPVLDGHFLKRFLKNKEKFTLQGN